MARTFLIGLLIASQLVLGWGVPLYACVAADGSVAVEWAAASCRCHAEEPAAASDHEEETHEHRCCAEHRDDPLSVVETTASHDCSCTHLPLSGSSETSTTPSLKTGMERVVRFCAEVSAASLHVSPLTTLTSIWSNADIAPVASPAWGLLARTVLRC